MRDRTYFSLADMIKHKYKELSPIHLNFAVTLDRAINSVYGSPKELKELENDLIYLRKKLESPAERVFDPCYNRRATLAPNYFSRLTLQLQIVQGAAFTIACYCFLYWNHLTLPAPLTSTVPAYKSICSMTALLSLLAFWSAGFFIRLMAYGNNYQSQNLLHYDDEDEENGHPTDGLDGEETEEEEESYLVDHDSHTHDIEDHSYFQSSMQENCLKNELEKERTIRNILLIIGALYIITLPATAFLLLASYTSYIHFSNVIAHTISHQAFLMFVNPPPTDKAVLEVLSNKDYFEISRQFSNLPSLIDFTNNVYFYILLTVICSIVSLIAICTWLSMNLYSTEIKHCPSLLRYPTLLSNLVNRHPNITADLTPAQIKTLENAHAEALDCAIGEVKRELSSVTSARAPSP